MGYDLKQKISCLVTPDEPVFAYILMDVFFFFFLAVFVSFLLFFLFPFPTGSHYRGEAHIIFFYFLCFVYSVCVCPLVCGCQVSSYTSRHLKHADSSRMAD